MKQDQQKPKTNGIEVPQCTRCGLAKPHHDRHVEIPGMEPHEFRYGKSLDTKIKAMTRKPRPARK